MNEFVGYIAHRLYYLDLCPVFSGRFHFLLTRTLPTFTHGNCPYASLTFSRKDTGISSIYFLGLLNPWLDGKIAYEIETETAQNIA